MTFIELEKIERYGKILVNLYIPTEDGTTELDLVYITHSGVYVLEVKTFLGGYSVTPETSIGQLSYTKVNISF